MFKNPFSFNGRIRRLEFGLSYIMYFLSIMLISFISELLGSSEIVFLLFIPLLWFVFAQAAKRCHDRGNSGFYVFVPLYILWLLFAESDFGENEYGPNPKGDGNKNEIEEIGNTEG